VQSVASRARTDGPALAVGAWIIFFLLLLLLPLSPSGACILHLYHSMPPCDREPSCRPPRDRSRGGATPIAGCCRPRDRHRRQPRRTLGWMGRLASRIAAKANLACTYLRRPWRLLSAPGARVTASARPASKSDSFGPVAVRGGEGAVFGSNPPPPSGESRVGSVA